MEPNITINESDLDNQTIDDVINLEKSLAAAVAPSDEEEIKTPFYLNPIFYYSIASLSAVLIVWGITEPFYNDTPDENNPFIKFPILALFADYLLFGPMAGLIGLLIGMSYGISNRNWKQAFICGFIGLGVGMLATIVTDFLGSIIYGILGTIAALMAESDPSYQEGEYYKGMAFFIQMCGRGIGWSLVSLGAGAGLGVALKSKKLLFNGIVGGMIGGLFGGLLFDPIARFIFSEATEAAISRGVGFSCVGLFVGFFIGLIENASKEAWFLMQKGKLVGKQFILFKNPTLIGSSPKCDIYLFKDSAVAPRHASVKKSGNKYIIKDEGSESGLFVNGRRTETALLQANDIITIGETVLKYSEREKNL